MKAACAIIAGIGLFLIYGFLTVIVLMFLGIMILLSLPGLLYQEYIQLTKKS